MAVPHIPTWLKNGRGVSRASSSSHRDNTYCAVSKSRYGSTNRPDDGSRCRAGSTSRVFRSVSSATS